MTQQSENVCYLPMSLERHSPSEVACLIYESAPELFALMFGSSAVACLTELVQRSHNRFSHHYIRVADIKHRVIGIAVLVPATHVTDDADYRDILNFSQKLWLNLLQRFLLRYVLHTSTR